jgi:NAD(P)-dependent dehydrogenase (short-subunit alcohol dehydrogenase family)
MTVLDRFRLDGKVAIVTGASSGLGVSFARTLAEAGADVALGARRVDRLADTASMVEGLGRRAITVATDVSRPEDCTALVEAALGQLGRVDVLVNNAAITFPGDLELPMPRFDLVFDVDLRAPVLATAAVVPAMRERREGAILNVSSLAALNYFPGLMAYGMAKAALEHFTVSAAAQLAPHGIAVNTFRIDLPVASEGFLANLPELDHSDWEPPEVAAEGIVWMLQQPVSWTGNNLGMARLRAEHGIMASRAAREHRQQPDVVTDTHLRSVRE